MQNDSSLAATGVSAVSQILLTLFGVDYYAMIWAFVGSILALTHVKKMTRGRALIYVALSTLIGAAFGSVAVAFMGTGNRAFLIGASVIGGTGSQLIVAAALQAVLNRIKVLGGANEPTPPAN